MAYVKYTSWLYVDRLKTLYRRVFGVAESSSDVYLCRGLFNYLINTFLKALQYSGSCIENIITC